MRRKCGLTALASKSWKSERDQNVSQTIAQSLGGTYEVKMWFNCFGIEILEV